MFIGEPYSRLKIFLLLFISQFGGICVDFDIIILSVSRTICANNSLDWIFTAFILMFLKSKSDRGVILVIDSGTTAMLASLVAARYPVSNIILEKKDGIDMLHDYEKAALFIFTALRSIDSIVLHVPSPYYLYNQSDKFYVKVKKLWTFRSSVLSKSTLPDGHKYLGPMTSSVMQCSTSREREYLDHGLGEPAFRASCLNRRGFHKALLMAKSVYKQLLKSIFRIPFCDLSLSKCHALCLLKGDNSEFYDFRDLVVSSEFKDILSSIKEQFFSKRKPILLLAVGNIHTEKGLPVYSQEYDAVNLSIILKHVAPTDFVVTKFHGSLYAAGKSPDSELQNLLAESGYDSIDIDACLPDFLKGHVPAEVLAKELCFSKVLCCGSATVFNMAHVHNIELISDLSGYSSNPSLHSKIVDVVNLVNPRLSSNVRIDL